MSKLQVNIPNHWKWVTLNEVSKKITDGSHNPPKGIESGVPMLSARNIQNNSIDFSNVRYLSNEDFEIENHRTNLEPDDVLLTTVATIGRVALVPSDNSKFVLQRSVTVIKPLINPKYLLYYIQSTNFQKELIENSSGTAQKGIYLNTLKALKIPLAPVEEQNRIVEKIEESIENISESINEITEQIKLIPAYKQLNINKLIKEEGTKTNLSNIAKFIDYRGKTPKKTKSGVRLITAKNVKNGFISFEPEEFISEDDYIEWMSRGIPKRGDVFITTEAPLGNIAEYDFDEKIALAQRIITMQPKSELNGTYLKYYLMSSEFQKVLKLKSTGTTVNGIKSNTLKKMYIYYPNIKEQLVIVNELDALNSFADKLKTELLETLIKIESLKLKILQDAFQGKLSSKLNKDTSVESLLIEIKNNKEKYLKEEQEIIKNRPKIKRMEKEKLSIIQVLEKHKKPISSKQLWKDSMFSDDIEKFYSELKKIQNKIKQENSESETLISLI